MAWKGQGLISSPGLLILKSLQPQALWVEGSVGNYSRGNCMQTELWGVSSRSDRPGWFLSRLTNGNDHEETARNKINFGKGHGLLPSLEGTEPSNLGPIAA